MSSDGLPDEPFLDIALDLRAMALCDAMGLEEAEKLQARLGTPMTAQALRDGLRQAEMLGKFAVLLERLAPLETETRSALVELLRKRECLP